MKSGAALRTAPTAHTPASRPRAWISGERPIVFSAAMLGAILRGEKTETRRLFDPRTAVGLPRLPGVLPGVFRPSGPPDHVLDFYYHGGRCRYGYEPPLGTRPMWQVQRLCSEACKPSPPDVYPPTGHADWNLRACPVNCAGRPFGGGECTIAAHLGGPYDGRHPVAWGVLPFWPGLRLWVKETFRLLPRSPRSGPRGCPRSPDGKLLAQYKRDYEGLPTGQPWVSPRFMPRWASRTEIVVTAVRPERLTVLSEADARAEGIRLPAVARICPCRTQVENPGPHVATCPWRDLSVDPLRGRPYASEYAILWNRLHGAQSLAAWSTDPFVWVITFARPSPP